MASSFLFVDTPIAAKELSYYLHCIDNCLTNFRPVGRWERLIDYENAHQFSMEELSLLLESDEDHRFYKPKDLEFVQVDYYSYQATSHVIKKVLTFSKDWLHAQYYRPYATLLRCVNGASRGSVKFSEHGSLNIQAVIDAQEDIMPKMTIRERLKWSSMSPANRVNCVGMLSLIGMIIVLAVFIPYYTFSFDDCLLVGAFRYFCFFSEKEEKGSQVLLLQGDHIYNPYAMPVISVVYRDNVAVQKGMFHVNRGDTVTSRPINDWFFVSTKTRKNQITNSTLGSFDIYENNVYYALKYEGVWYLEVTPFDSFMWSRGKILSKIPYYEPQDIAACVIIVTDSYVYALDAMHEAPIGYNIDMDEWTVLPGGNITGIPRSMTAHKKTDTLFVYYTKSFIAKYDGLKLTGVITPHQHLQIGQVMAVSSESLDLFVYNHGHLIRHLAPNYNRTSNYSLIYEDFYATLIYNEHCNTTGYVNILFLFLLVCIGCLIVQSAVACGCHLRACGKHSDDGSQIYTKLPNGDFDDIAKST